MHPHIYEQTRRTDAGTQHATSRWMRTSEAAAYIKHGESTLEKLRLRGGGPPFTKRGSVVVYDRVDLDRWLEERKIRSTSERPRAA